MNGVVSLLTYTLVAAESDSFGTLIVLLEIIKGKCMAFLLSYVQR